MPRKKRARKRYTDDDVNTFPSKRRHAEYKGETLVISDSENEEEECTPTVREVRLQGREKTQTRELTEQEMLDLAMRLSEQEAGNAALRQQEEEEAMKKAIAESLHANGLQTNNDNSKPLLLAMTPNQGSQSTPSQSLLPAAESPVFPPRQKPLYSSQSKRGGDTATEDQFTTATVLDVNKLSNPLSHSPDPSQSPSVCPETPLLPLLDSEKANTSLRKEPDTDSDRESQDCSSKSHPQPGNSPVFPKSSPHKLVLHIEKLSQDLVTDCHTVGFVLCSQNDHPGLAASGRSSPQLSPAPPESPTFPRTNPREDGKGPNGRGAQSFPEPITVTVQVVSGGKEPSEASPHSQGHSLSRKVYSERTSKLKRTPLSQRLVPVESMREDTDRDGEDADQEQHKEQPYQRSVDQTSEQSAHEGVPEHTDGTALLAATRPIQDFPTQMTLNWSDDEDEGEKEDSGKIKQECLNVAETHSPPTSQNAVCEQSSTSDSESLLRVVPASVPSPVFRRDVICFKPRIGASPNPASCAGVSGLRCARRKFSFRNMYAVESAMPPVTSRQAEPSSSTGRSSAVGQLTPTKEEQGEGTVLYYWGVPFCPRGQNPDEYTQVILTQLEVYEKSLKEAQRGLLRKVEWGEPVLPGPPKRPLARRTRLKRYRTSRPLEEEEEGEEEPGIVEETDEAAEEGDRAESQRGSEAGGGKGREVQDGEAIEVPSPGLAQEKSPLHVVQEEPPEKLMFLRRRGLRERSPAESETQPLVAVEEEEEEEEEGMCPETQMSEENTLDVNMESPAGSQPRPESEVMEVVEDGNGHTPAAAEEELRMEVEVEMTEPAAQSHSERVECPICMRGFPLSQIEMHAAYCDSTADDNDPEETNSQVMVLRKSTRRVEVIDEDQPSSSGSGKATQGEKCFICQGLFPGKEYLRHVDACIHQRSTRANEGTKGLLPALDQSEQKDSESGPSHSAFRNKEHSRSVNRVDAEESSGSGDTAFPVSTSPIRSFTPISEAADCLIDFKRQYSSRPSQRAGRKRKFKR
ncbi:hypothetical protein AAFF_G00189340 [Aldrovandia affinis]|uniref:BRCA1-A complex subunit RAP80 n=1 Tax=Aldrovandia affinis TaxID=143900 RepID=A0AAD7W6Q2_9TELE|nr:hypothetical protein AAFF_G00189340 [Aldrovandia affinis]